MPPDEKARLIAMLRRDIETHREMALKQMAHAAVNLWRDKYDIAARHIQHAVNHAKDALRCHATLQMVRSEL